MREIAILLRVKKMVTVVFPGAENKACAKAVCAALERFGGAIFADGTEISDFAPVASVFFVYNGESIKSVPKRESVLLLTEDAPKTSSAVQNEFAYVLTSAPSADIAKKSCLSVGMGKDCDISVSSIEGMHLQICLQRTLKTFSGKEILPCEFSVQCKEKMDLKPALFAFSVLLLCDKANTKELKIQL